jgi:hypothetical protein
MTSHTRRQLHVVEPSPVRHEPQEPPTEEPSPAADSAVPQLDGDEQAGLDAAARGWHYFCAWLFSA